MVVNVESQYSTKYLVPLSEFELESVIEGLSCLPMNSFYEVFMDRLMGYQEELDNL